MWHAVLIGLHAASGGVALLAGLVAHRGRALFAIYLWALVAAIVLLVAAVVEEWGRIDAASRILFAAFAVLGGYMVWRAVRARRIQPAGSVPSPRYVDHVGFTVVGLADAFLVITVLNVGAPVAVVAGVLGAIAGHYALRAAKASIVPVSVAG